MDTGAHLGQLFWLNNYVTKTRTMVCAPGQVELKGGSWVEGRI